MSKGDKKNHHDHKGKEGIDLLEHQQTKMKPPRRYKVIIHNDDFTPQNFVVEVLHYFFNKSEQEAYKIMMTAHQSGKAIVGLYSKEVAETKVAIAMQYARNVKYPLLFTFEPEE